MAYKAVEFNTATNFIEVVSALDPSLVSPSTPPANGVMTAQENLANGTLVSLIDSGGQLMATLANAAATCSQPVLPAHGFVLQTFTTGQQVRVFLAGIFVAYVDGATAANIGNFVYLSGSIPGGVSLNPPLPTKTWLPNTAYNLGDIIVDTNGNWETVTTAGTSGATEPSPWATICGNTTTDNTVTWTMGPASYEQIVGQIVYYDPVSLNCSIVFQPLLNIGNVTSVGLAMPSDFAVGGSPIVNAGTFFVTWLPQAAHAVHIGPTSGTGVPTWRVLAISDFFGGTNASATTFLRGDGTWDAAVQTVQQAGVSVAQEPRLNFLSPITVTDNPGNTSSDVAVPVMGASGASHSSGLVPDPGAVAGTTRFLREDATWQIVAEVISSDHPGQTASLGPVTVLTPAITGMFRVSVYEECTVAGAAGGGQPFGSGVYGSGVFNAGDDTVQTSVSWTDDSGTRSATPVTNPLDLAELNAASGDIFIRSVAGQPITFTSALAATGTPTYGVFVRLEAL